MIASQVPDSCYSAFKQPIVAFGKRGYDYGELSNPRGVSIEPTTEYIYVTDVEDGRIQIFSQTGDHIDHFGNTHLYEPWGILIHLYSIYVTDIGYHAIFLFRLPELRLVKRVGKKGYGREEFICPGQLAISPNQQLYVPDEYNNRLQILSTDLEFQNTLKHQSMTNPCDVKFSNNEMFVLSSVDDTCIHVFTLSGEKSRSLAPSGYGMPFVEALFFCLDGQGRFIISDNRRGIRVLSPGGHLLHTIREKRIRSGVFIYHHGVTIHNKNKLISVSDNIDYCIQIFSYY